MKAAPVEPPNLEQIDPDKKKKKWTEKRKSKPRPSRPNGLVGDVSTEKGEGARQMSSRTSSEPGGATDRRIKKGPYQPRR